MNGTKNCTAACLDRITAWTPPLHTLQNCLAYPFISKSLSLGVLDAASTNLAHEYGIVDAESIDLKTITALTGSCVDSYCDGDDKYCTPFDSKALMNTSVQHRMWTEV